MKAIICAVALAAALATAAGAEAGGRLAGEDYPVGLQDVLAISVLRPDKMDLEATVGPDGTISVPYIGEVRVKGLSLRQVQGEIQKRLADGYMKYPEVAVALKESHANKFFVSGDVLHPGAYPMEDRTTVLKAISVAGGFANAGSHGTARLMRSGRAGSSGEILRIQVNGEGERASTDDNVVLQPGDTLVVSEDKFYAYGEVAKPGTYPLDDNTTVMKAISIVGGFTKYGAYSRVKVLRPKKSGGGTDIIPVDTRAIMEGAEGSSVMLQPGDTVVVSEDKFFVYGEVTHPGTYPMEENTTVLKAISIAGGFTKYGSAGRVKMLRPKKGGRGYDTIKVDIKGAMSGSSDGGDLLLEPGDTVVVSAGMF